MADNALLRALGVIGDVLDTPGSVSRGLLAGDTDRAFGGIFDPSRRISGRGLLESYGMVDAKPEEAGMDFGDALGFGASILTDPLTYLSLGGGVAAKAALARKASTPIGELAAKAIPESIPVAKLAPPIPTAKKVVPAFYSRLEEGIAKLPESIKSESVINQLKKMGVTNEEIESTNLAKALEGKPRVSKQELMNHFGENKVQVEEVMKGGMTPEQAAINKRYEYLSDHHELLTDAQFEELNQLEKQVIAGGPKFPDYQTPGSSNYRELLLKTPQKELPEGLAIKRVDNPHAKGGISYQVVDSNGKPLFQEAMYPTHEQAAQKANDYMSSFENQNFRGSHWEEPNVLAHVRFNDRFGPNGEKILHIEEIQSDWHQTGKKHGYLSDTAAELAKAQDEARVISNRIDQMGASDFTDLAFAELSGKYTQPELEELTSLFKRIDELSEFRPGVPHGPFKENWHELSMKRMIRYAAEHNYDEITLNSGEQINKVLGGGTESLAGQKKFYDEQLPNWMKKYAKQHGVKVETIKQGSSPLSTVPGIDSREVVNAMNLMPPGDREIAQKAWMQGIADGDPDTVVSNLLEKYGLLDMIRGARSTATRMPLNASMREQALTRGLPLMQMGAGAGGSALLAAILSQENS